MNPSQRPRCIVKHFRATMPETLHFLASILDLAPLFVLKDTSVKE
jgi:hypothetical protein